MISPSGGRGQSPRQGQNFNRKRLQVQEESTNRGFPAVFPEGKQEDTPQDS